MSEKNLTASEMGKRSAEARKKKFKIKNWSAHMKKVRKGKAKDLTTSVRQSPIEKGDK